MTAKRTHLSVVVCILATIAQAVPSRAQEGEIQQESRPQASMGEMVVGQFRILPHWDIDYVGMHTPAGPPYCWYNPLDGWVTTMRLSCHRPDDVLAIEESVTVSTQFSVAGENTGEINWEGFRLALLHQEGILIGASVTRSVSVVITPFDCYDATVWAYSPYQCLVYDVTWTWLWVQKTATVYVWRPVDGVCLVWSDAEFQPTCDGCDEPYPPPDAGNWFCASDDIHEPVWADWCDQGCTDDPNDIGCESVALELNSESEDVTVRAR